MPRRGTPIAALALIACASFCNGTEPDPAARLGPRFGEPPAPVGRGPVASDEPRLQPLDVEFEEQGWGAGAAGGERLAGVRGPRDNPSPHLRRTRFLEEADRLAGIRPFRANDFGRTGEVEGIGLGPIGQIGHGYGTGYGGVGFGRSATGKTGFGGRMGRGRGGAPTGSAGGVAADPLLAGALSGRGSHGWAASYDETAAALDCSDADEVVVVADDGDGPIVADGSATQGTLRAKTASGEAAGEFPLRHTEVSAEISGFLARTEVEQVYANPFREPIEAVYVFPLPAMGAIHDFVMEVGGRKIVGVIRPREEAERIYVEARASGRTASLLTQERPNVFTQSVANIAPGGEVKIRVAYVERLAYDRGGYEWVFPMVVGPRYVEGAPRPAEGRTTDPATGATETGGGTAAPTDRVPDADRVTPPALRPGERSGHDIGLTVTLDAGLPIADVRSAAHAVDVVEESATRRVIKLRPSDSIPNKDFVLRWSVAGDETRLGLLAHRGERGGFFTLMLQPPAAPSDAQVAPREINFLLDVSGSMQGLPLAISKAVVEKTLDRLRPDDTFNLFYFSGANGQLWDRPRRRSEEDVAEAKRFLASLEGGGGTRMLDGLRRTLGAEHDPGRMRMIVFCTDGFVAEDEEILRVVETERGDARFFLFGIGSSVNRYLVDGIAEHGGGAAEVVLTDAPGDACRAVDRLFATIDSPVLTDVRIDWNGLPVEEVYPARLPDLFAGRTIGVVGRYTSAAAGTAFVEGRVGTRPVRLPVIVALPETEERHEALASVWARWRIEDLSNRLRTADEPEREDLKKRVTDLAVEFRLASPFTAFVAVDESRVVGNGRPLRVIQPVELPSGVSFDGAVGEAAAGGTFEIPAWGLTVRATEAGGVQVVRVAGGSAADRAGVPEGAAIRTVNRTAVHDVSHLEGLLLQSSGGVRLELEPGGTVDLPAL